MGAGGLSDMVRATLEKLRAEGKLNPQEPEPTVADAGPAVIPTLDRYERILPPRFAYASFATFNADPALAQCATQLATVHEWSDTFPHVDRGLFLYGGTGLGKSHAAIAAGRLVAKRGARVRYLDLPTWIDGLSERASKRADQVVRGVDLLVVDELGAQAPNSFIVDKTCLLINEAWKQDVRVVITSNLSLREVFQQLGERTSSRIADLARPVQFGGDGAKDYRLKKAKGVKK